MIDDLFATIEESDGDLNGVMTDFTSSQSTGGITDYNLLTGKPAINGTVLQGNLTPEDVGVMPMFTGVDETDPDTSLKGLMFVQCTDDLEAVLGMPRAYIHQYFYSTGAIAENQTRLQIAVAYGDVAKIAIRQYYGNPKTWTAWAGITGENNSVSDVSLAISAHNHSADAHPDIRSLINKFIGDLNGKVDTTNIVNNLESDAVDKPLSAAQGKALKKFIDAFTVPEEIVIGKTDEEALEVNATLIINPDAVVNPDSIFMTAAEVPAVVSNYVGDVLLWENKTAPWSSGSITVAVSNGSAGCTKLGNLSDFERIVVVFSDVFSSEGYKSATALRGGFAVNISTGEMYSYGYYFAVNGNTLTRTKVTRTLHETNGNKEETYTGGVTAIYGIPSRRA